MSGFTESHRRIPYIDGLRAVAIVAVVAFHLESAIIPGGFLGVDVFFVISGFVITSSLTSAFHGATPSLMRFLEWFYRRRFWRIVPALVCMLAMGLGFGMLWIPPAWLSSLNPGTGIAASLGVSNIALSQMGGESYFATREQFNPFLHTWSLGVEEQFYLIVPLLLFLTLRPSKRGWVPRMATTVIPLLTVGSFVLAVHESSTDPTSAFYLIPFRFWELAAGVLAFQLASTVRRYATATRLRSVLALCGLSAIAAGYAGLFTTAQPVPAGILPVFGTVLLLWFTPGTTSINRVLSLAPVTYTGRISYSWYLWHWPIIVYLDWTIGITTWWTKAIAIVLSLGLAAASYHLIELPFQRWRPARIRLMAVPFVAAVAAVIFTAVHVLSYERSYQFAVPLPNMTPVATQVGWDINDLPSVGRVTSKYPRSTSWIYFVGDSHAGMYQGLAAQAANLTGRAVAIAQTPTCAFLFYQPVALADCPGLRRHLSTAKKGDVVVFAALLVRRFVNQWGPISSAATPEPTADPAAIAQLAEIAKRLTRRGVIVVLQSPTPVFKTVLFRCVSWPTDLNPLCDAPRTVPRDVELQRAAPALAAEAEVRAADPQVVIWNAFDGLCPGSLCSMYDGHGHPLYLDQDHISGWGNQTLLPSFLALIGTRAR